MADHILETLEYEQSKNRGLVNRKGAESVKRMTWKCKFRWLVGQGFTPPLSRPPNQNSWIRPCCLHKKNVNTIFCSYASSIVNILCFVLPFHDMGGEDK